MRAHDRGRFQQVGVWQLLVLTTAAAVVLVILAPRIRQAPGVAAIEAIGFLLSVAGVGGYLLRKRRRIERDAGALIERFEPRASRWWTWLAGSALWGVYLFTVCMEWTKPDELNLVPGSLWLLWFAIVFLVVRMWWRIDPMAIEACEHGLIVGGLRFYNWADINRHSWSETPPRLQLNLFLKSRSLVHLKPDAEFVVCLDRILSEREGREAAENARVPVKEQA
jgi:hypothetical protein